MLKNSKKNENTTHFTYNEYKKKVNKKENKDLTIFMSVFFISVLVFLGFAKLLSPNVDLGISNISDEESVMSDDDISSGVDGRLGNIKDEDDGKELSSDDMFSPELDEKVILPMFNHKTTGQIEAEKMQKETKQETSASSEKSQEQTDAKSQPAPKPLTLPHHADAKAQGNVKVVVGYYATENQAVVAKSIIQDAGLSMTPTVKNMGGYYTLLMGSYPTKEKAQQVVNDLLRNNFPARLIAE